LTGEGYEVDTATDGNTGSAMALTGNFEIIVLDVMLPGKSGFDVCREVRQHGVDAAILMLTARTQVVDRVVGSKLGADDYLTKPFEPAELVARIEALGRRVSKGNSSPVVRFKFGEIAVDFDRGEVIKNGITIALTGRESQLLRYSIHHRG
ncbi:hypothetical protein OY671_012498, partial [Metschnikowia pulcherrima]